MTILKKAAIAIAATGGAVLLASLFLPSTARVERSIVVEAPQATVFDATVELAQF